MRKPCRYCGDIRCTCEPLSCKCDDGPCLCGLRIQCLGNRRETVSVLRAEWDKLRVYPTPKLTGSTSLIERPVKLDDVLGLPVEDGVVIEWYDFDKATWRKALQEYINRPMWVWGKYEVVILERLSPTLSRVMFPCDDPETDGFSIWNCYLKFAYKKPVVEKTPTVHHVSEFVYTDGSRVASCRECRMGEGHYTDGLQACNGRDLTSHVFNAHIFSDGSGDGAGYLKRHEIDQQTLEVITTTVTASRPTLNLFGDELTVHNVLTDNVVALRRAASDDKNRHFKIEAYHQGIIDALELWRADRWDGECDASLLVTALECIRAARKRAVRDDNNFGTHRLVQVVDEDQYTPINIQSGSHPRIDDKDTWSAERRATERGVRFMLRTQNNLDEQSDSPDNDSESQENDGGDGDVGYADPRRAQLYEDYLIAAIDGTLVEADAMYETAVECLGQVKADVWLDLYSRKHYPQRHVDRRPMTSTERSQLKRWTRYILRQPVR